MTKISPTKTVSLDASQIARLEQQGCQSPDWTRVMVSDKTDLSLVRGVRFYGDVQIGELQSDAEHLQGIYNAVVRDCVIGDNCYISNVAGEMRGCTVGKRVRIENVGRIVFDAEADCGQGVAVGVFDETGSRPVYIYPGLTAQMASLMAYKPRWTEEHLHTMLQDYFIENPLPTMIGDDASVVDTVCMVNVSVDREVAIEGAVNLRNGAVINNAPKGSCLAHIGHGVNAENFIIEDGVVANGVVMRNCFVGQGAVLDKGFTAHDSLFFANCACENGEACAVFAGPYTVTMHKSTLLIGGQYSFMNAGSGTNSSNHMYKLGPIHWGVMQRGVKTSSGAYMMWGGRVGAFSLLMGAHKRHADTALFPFSYLFADNDGYTIVVPGVMMKSCGLKRDETKWPARDKRVKKRLPRHDNIVFDVLNPPIVSSMLEALRVFNELEAKGPESDGMYHYNGLRIKHSSLIKGREVYRIAVLKYLYDKTRDIDMSTIEAEQIDWVDLAGQIMPRSILNDIYEMESLDEISEAFNQAYNDYSSAELRWVKWVLEQGWAEQMSEAEVAARQFDADIEADRLRSREMLSQHNNLLSL